MQSVFLLWRVCPVCSMVKRRFPARTPEVERLFMLPVSIDKLFLMATGFAKTVQILEESRRGQKGMNSRQWRKSVIGRWKAELTMMTVTVK